MKKFFSIALVAIFALSVLGARGASAADRQVINESYYDSDIGIILLDGYTNSAEGATTLMITNDWKAASVVVNLQKWNGSSWIHVSSVQQDVPADLLGQFIFWRGAYGDTLRFHVKYYSHQTGNQIASYHTGSFYY